MKIKCPIIQNRGFECNDEFVDSEQLSAHFGRCHSFMDISNTLNKQTFKIHEKIQEVQHSLEYNRDVKKYDVDCEEWALEKLKSLLENE